MKILTWNLGLCYWMKYRCFNNNFFTKTSVKNHYFHEGNATFIKKILQKVQPDFGVFQEILNPDNLNSIDWQHNNGLKNKHLLFPSYYHKHETGVISQIPILKNHTKEYNQERFNIIELKDIFIIPIHLQTFSPQKRFETIKKVIEITKTLSKPFFIIGDFNIWQHRKFFFHTYDKKTYNLLTQYAEDITKNIYATNPIGISFDKIFTNMKYKHCKATVLKKRGHYMDHYPVYIEIE